MKIKFGTFENVKRFIEVAGRIESGLLIKKGRYIIDGKSLLGILSLDLSSDLELEFVETKEKEIEKFVNKLYEIGIVM